MKRISSLSNEQKNICALVIVILLLSILYLSGIADVPFHPDESTYIFMSDDLQFFFSNLPSMFWQPGQVDNLHQHYRKLDPPTSRAIIGISRSIAGQQALPADWDWALTWQENQQAGALPDSDLLTVSRIGIAIFYPFSLLFLYLSVNEVSDRLTAWLAMLFMAGNLLVLLHTRRAMTESFMLFTIILSLYFLLHFREKPWLSAFPITLALNAKLSTAPFAAVGGLVILLIAFQNKWPLKKIIGQLAVYGLIILALSFILNPFLWAHPFSAAQSAWESRLALTDRQVATVAEVSPEQVLDSPAKRVGNLIAHLFYTPPAIADVANYLEETAQSAEAYLAKPLHSLGRGLIFGSLGLVFSLVGFLISLLDLLRSKSLPMLILFLSGLAQTAAILLLVPLPFQRYILPAVPFACFWLAYSIAKFANGITAAIKKKSSTPQS
jgi:Dolichyl-phosphate-mannose-protein mannosyltransferase